MRWRKKLCDVLVTYQLLYLYREGEQIWYFDACRVMDAICTDFLLSFCYDKCKVHALASLPLSRWVFPQPLRESVPTDGWVHADIILTTSFPRIDRFLISLVMEALLQKCELKSDITSLVRRRETHSCGLKTWILRITPYSQIRLIKKLKSISPKTFQKGAVCWLLF